MQSHAHVLRYLGLKVDPVTLYTLIKILVKDRGIHYILIFKKKSLKKYFIYTRFEYHL